MSTVDAETLKRRADVIELSRQGLSQRQIAKRLGVSATFAQKWLAKRGHAPEHDMTHTVPDGYGVKGVSTLYGPNGEIRGQWVKSNVDRERQLEIVREQIGAWTADLPKLQPRKARGDYAAELLTAYPIGDPHIGALAWAAECGKDWDLAIAERVHCGAMQRLVESAPASERALIVNLGDALHYDSMAPVTARSGHALDADGRYAKMVGVTIKVMRRCIESALDKHRTVHVINAPGNHDETGALWLSIALAQIYEREPRVTVDTTPAVFAYYRWGKCLIGVHHGHTCKPDKLPGVMAADRAKDWGDTEHRYWWMGHIHHQTVKEHPGVSVESFNTLAAKDAYATAGGWRARESMKAIVLHREFGEVARHTVHPKMLAAA